MGIATTLFRKGPVVLSPETLVGGLGGSRGWFWREHPGCLCPVGVPPRGFCSLGRRQFHDGLAHQHSNRHFGNKFHRSWIFTAFLFMFCRNETGYITLYCFL